MGTRTPQRWTPNLHLKRGHLPSALVRRGRPQAKLLNTLSTRPFYFPQIFPSPDADRTYLSLSVTHMHSISSTRRPGHPRPARALHLGKTGALQRCAGATVLPRRVEHALRDPREQPWLHHLVSRGTASGRVRVGPGPTAVARPPIGTGAHACMCAWTRACTCTCTRRACYGILYTCGACAVHMAHVTGAYATICHHMAPYATI